MKIHVIAGFACMLCAGASAQSAATNQTASASANVQSAATNQAVAASAKPQTTATNQAVAASAKVQAFATNHVAAASTNAQTAAANSVEDTSAKADPFAKKADGRVRRALESAGLPFWVDNDEDFVLLFETQTHGSGRSQTVYIDSNTEWYGGIELRNVWSVGFVADEVSENDLRKLLELNNQYRMGAWAMTKDCDGKWRVFFCVKVSGDCRAGDLRSVADYVAEAADQMERATSKGDIY